MACVVQEYIFGAITIVQQLAAQIPRFHDCVLLDKVRLHEERVDISARTSPVDAAEMYLVRKIESSLHERQERARGGARTSSMDDCRNCYLGIEN